MSYEIECPVCDRKTSSTATVCQHCGADLKMASLDELEEVAYAVAAGKAPPKAEAATTSKAADVRPEAPSKAAPGKETEPGAQPAKAQAAEAEPHEAESPEKSKEEKKEEEGKRGLGRLFGKKKK